MYRLRRVISGPTWLALFCRLSRPVVMTRSPFWRLSGAARTVPMPSSLEQLVNDEPGSADGTGTVTAPCTGHVTRATCACRIDV